MSAGVFVLHPLTIHRKSQAIALEPTQQTSQMPSTMEVVWVGIGGLFEWSTGRDGLELDGAMRACLEGLFFVTSTARGKLSCYLFWSTAGGDSRCEWLRSVAVSGRVHRWENWRGGLRFWIGSLRWSLLRQVLSSVATQGAFICSLHDQWSSWCGCLRFKINQEEMMMKAKSSGLDLACLVHTCC